MLAVLEKPDVAQNMLDAPDSSDAELVRRCLAGDQRAWSDLIDRYGRLVCATARRWGLSQADAEDTMQIVFTQAFRNLGKLRDVDRLVPWLITTTRRACWQHSRRATKTLALDSSPAPSATFDASAEATLEQQHLVRQAMDELPQRDRDLLTALFLESPNQVCYKSIAARFGMRMGSIGPTRARAFKRLEEILLRMGFDPREAIFDRSSARHAA